MRWIILLLLTQIVAFGQASKPEELSAIEGLVLNSATGAPLTKAALTLARIDQKSEQSNWDQSYTGTSDASGKFLIRNIVPGRYRLRAKRTGFLDFEYGAHTSQPTGTVLDLNRPQQIKNAELRLSPQGVITGRVLDADGDPMANVRLQILRLRYANGKKVPVAMNPAGANDLGEYRFSGLQPGRYYVFAEAGRLTTPLSEVHEEYASAYYPGSTDVNGASPIDILPGSQVRAGDLILHKERTVTVSGRVVVNVPGVDRIAHVYFSRRGGHENAGAFGTQTPVAIVNSAGEFEVHGIMSGSYMAGVSVVKNGVSYYSGVKVEVGGSDVRGVVITADAGLTIAGRIVVEGETKEPLSGLRVSFLKGKSVSVSGESWQGDRVAKDQTFQVTHMSPDLYNVELAGIPEGFYLKRIRAGSVDVTYSGIDLRSGANDVIEVVLSPKAGVVSGAVQSADKNETVPGATIVLVPKEQERQQIPMYYSQSTTDQYGRFALKNLPPGDYKAYAWEDVESTAWMDPEFMAPLADKGVAVTVAESGQLNILVEVMRALADVQRVR